ncbi:queuosine precursor transporter [Serratia symbiotica]|uniref:queuosine precursor transporter n=1 Tax=Serratia symbiotica TaxID=138074 RepID=UPI001E50D3C3|nr:queuosine precursor transporter [Serratia symbiotica]
MKNVMGNEPEYKLLGFEPKTHAARILICTSGKILSIHVNDLERSEIAEKLSSREIKALYRHIYMDKLAPETEYQLKDRSERSWGAYVAFVLALAVFYQFSNIAAIKPVYISHLDIIVTPGTFIYPFTFLIIDLLNEFYGFRLARKAILCSVISNIVITLLLFFSMTLPVIPEWHFNVAYNDFMTQLYVVLLASTMAFITSELSNSWILCKIKAITRSRHLYLRIFLSTFAASIIDSFVFCFLAFYGKMDNSVILKIAMIQIIIKSVYAFLNILPAYYARFLYRKHILHPGEDMVSASS